MKIVLLGVLLLVFGVGGFFAYEKIVNHRSPQTVINKLQGKEEQPAAVELAPEPIKPVYKFVEVPPIAISLSKNDRVQRILSASIVLEVPEGTDVKALEAMMPKMRDAFLSYFYKYMSVRSLTDDIIHDRHLQVRFRDIANEILSDPIVNNVMIQASFQRKV